MVLVGFECDESFKKAILKKSKASGLSLSEYLRRLISQDLDLDRDVQYMTRREVEELIDLKLLKSGLKGGDIAKEPLESEIKKSFKEKPTTEEPKLNDLSREILEDKFQQGLLFLAVCFDKGFEPTSDLFYQAAEIKNKKEKDTIGKMLKSHGIELYGTSREGKSVKIYRLELKETVEKLLDSTRQMALKEYRSGKAKVTWAFLPDEG